MPYALRLVRALPVRRGRVARVLTAIVVTAAIATTLPPGDAANAATRIVLSTAQRPLDIPLDEQVEPYSGFNQGWYSEETGHDGDGYDNPNYSTGWSEYYGELRSFFTFYLRSVRRPVISATLRLEYGCPSSANRSEVVRFFDVSTPATQLVRGVAPLEPTMADLGSGVRYATKTVTTTGAGRFVDVTLNRDAIAAINRARGPRYFSIGATVTSLTKQNGDETLFGCTGARPVQLVLTTR